MRGRSTERTSILLLGRNTVIIGAVLVTIVSFGLGYFFGYKGPGNTDTDKEDTGEVATKAKDGPPAEEKRVLESSPAKDAAGAQSGTPSVTQAATQITPPAPARQDSVKPPAPIPEIAPRKQSAPAVKAPGPPNPPKAAEEEAGGTPGPPERDKINKKQGRSDTKKKVAAKAPQKKKKTAAKSKGRTSPAEGKKEAESAKKAYTVQLGAFPTKEGAEQLRKSLEARGYKPYILEARQGDPYYRVRVGSYAGKKDAESSAGELTKQTGLQNFITTK